MIVGHNGGHLLTLHMHDGKLERQRSRIGEAIVHDGALMHGVSMLGGGVRHRLIVCVGGPLCDPPAL